MPQWFSVQSASTQDSIVGSAKAAFIAEDEKAGQSAVAFSAAAVLGGFTGQAGKE